MRQDWERQTEDVAAWAASAERGWRVEREEKELSEEVVGGAYRVPVVTIHLCGVRNKTQN